MEQLFQHVTEQYQAVRESRQVLFKYCATISTPDFLKEHESFGRGGSIRNLLVHVANVYEAWVVHRALGLNIPFTKFDSRKNISEVVLLFDDVDIFIYQFLDKFREHEVMQIGYELNGNKQIVSGLKLFTHVITHEFHHKGQVLSISRQMGYTPVDTDIIR